ncbi:metal ABC transporter solute-binding protein, Zn/Mn family [Bordetella genomosp. 4]|uniref:metal ABC transporter solute-binding protein, Zn/Mn family n=1 Tax=Bordetella genomosp. 4 TaxID=463044 RepID=UPI000B9E67FC|nr:zinc ABC transporter substrate-binding protein [Bordetella genomosp. 4]OZI41852.1 metal ABC transporter substrate-binding protein [Bordetella genomosp. 4]
MHNYSAAQARRRILMMLTLGAASVCAPVVAHSAEPLRVVASFSVLGDMVREIGGDDVSVTTLVGPDGDAHSYEPTPAAARQLKAASVLVENGLDFETWLPRLAKAADFSGATIVATAGITPRKMAEQQEGGHGRAGGGAHDHSVGKKPAQGNDDTHGHDHDHDEGQHHDEHEHGHDHDHDDSHAHADGGHHHHHGDQDPHAWQSLTNGVVYARNIAEGLAAADPAHAAAYRQRAQAYIARIEALDAQIRQTFAAIPTARRQVVSSHDAFGYFGDAYGVRFIPVAGLSTDAEPSAADMARIIELVKREHVPAVFVENVSSPALVQQIARETGARTGGTLYSDALAPSGQPAATYLGMFEWNARQLSEALQP